MGMWGRGAKPRSTNSVCPRGPGCRPGPGMCPERKRVLTAGTGGGGRGFGAPGPPWAPRLVPGSAQGPESLPVPLPGALGHIHILAPRASFPPVRGSFQPLCADQQESLSGFSSPFINPTVQKTPNHHISATAPPFLPKSSGVRGREGLSRPPPPGATYKRQRRGLGRKTSQK